MKKKKTEEGEDSELWKLSKLNLNYLCIFDVTQIYRLYFWDLGK